MAAGKGGAVAGLTAGKQASGADGRRQLAQTEGAVQEAAGSEEAAGQQTRQNETAAEEQLKQLAAAAEWQGWQQQESARRQEGPARPRRTRGGGRAEAPWASWQAGVGSCREHQHGCSQCS